MKSLKLNFLNLLIITTLLLSFKGIAQNAQSNTNTIMGTIITAGKDAIGSSGTVSYSIGQLFYTYIGQSVYNVAQGIQHQELYKTGSSIVNSIEPKVEVLVFPNPTTDFVTINTKGLEFEKGKQFYQLYDIQGRILKQNRINQNETQINLNNLTASIYLLKVYDNNKVLKTFKILKK
jgi:hypothetical protein